MPMSFTERGNRRLEDKSRGNESLIDSMEPRVRQAMAHATFTEGLRSARPTRFGYELVWVALGLGMATLGGAVGVRAMTGVLSPATYGELTLVVTLSALAHQTILGPLGQAFLRYFAPAHESGRFGAYLRGVWQLTAWAAGIIVTIAFLLVVLLVAVGRRDWVPLVWGTCFLSLVFGIGSSLDGVQNAARQQAVVAWHQGITPWLRFAGALGLVVEFGANAGNALMGYVLGSMAVLVSQILLFWRRILGQHGRRTVVNDSDVAGFVRQMRVYAWPFASWGILAWVQMASDRWALQVFHGARTVGIYAVLYQVGYVPMSMLSGLVLQLIVPVVFSRSGDGTDPHRLRSAHTVNLYGVWGVMLVTGFMTLAALLFRDQILALVAGPAYRVGAVYLPAVVLAGGLFASGQTASLVLMSGTDTRLLVRPKMVTAIAGVLFNVAGAYWYGLQGVVMANVLFGLLYFVWIAVLAWKYRTLGRFSDKRDDHETTFQPLL